MNMRHTLPKLAVDIITWSLAHSYEPFSAHFLDSTILSHKHFSILAHLLVSLFPLLHCSHSAAVDFPSCLKKKVSSSEISIQKMGLEVFEELLERESLSMKIMLLTGNFTLNISSNLRFFQKLLKIHSINITNRH